LAIWLNRAIQVAIANGDFAAVYERWRPELVPGERGAWTKWLALALLASVVMALIGGAWVFALRRIVAKRTADLRDELERRRSAEAAARYASDYDNHGLPRSHQFRALVAQALEVTSDFNEVLVVKLGTFEQTIRTLDYETGKDLIHAFARRVQMIGLPVCGRLSRDVFALLMRSAELDQRVAALSENLSVGPLSIFPNLRIGRAVRAKNNQTAEELIRCAEIALLEAMVSHRAMVTYEPSMQGSQDDLRLVGEFQGTAGAGLSAQFQPIIDIESGTIVGAEALVRWQHTELGSISPARFIPLLEQAGLIHMVTDRMLEEAIRVASIARRSSPACCISVNVTPNDLVSSQMRDLIKGLLWAHAVPAGALKLELTETSVVSQPDLVRASLQSLQALGVGLSVDDFGTGHSSLTHLTSFPFSELKIDREFVSGLTSDSRRRSIVRSTLSMARELELAVVAEGVEDQRTLTVLRHLRCDRAQGYGIAKPLPENEFLAMLRSAGRDGLPSEKPAFSLGYGGNA
jgi:EAL domain-containing protein (putative c-di-GMP-specific phosphodiesterase class I)